MSELDDVQIVLVEGEQERRLTNDQARAVTAAFDDVRREAVKFRRMLQRRGRLLVIDADLVARITAFLTTKDDADQ